MPTSLHKAVEVLRLLDAAAARSLLDRLAPEQATAIRAQLNSELPRTFARRQLHLLDEFLCGLQLAAPAPNLETPPRLHRPGSDPAPQFRPTGDPFADLVALNLHQVARAVEAEAPRAAAILLHRLPPERAAEILSALPDDRRDAVVRELNQERITPEPLVRRLALTVVARAIDLPSEPAQRTDRVARLAAVLRAVPKPLRQEMLAALREQDPDTAEALLQQLYTFDDLLRLPDRSVQQLLTEVDLTVLSTALAGASDELIQKVLANLSRRARSALQEELQFRSSVSPKDVQAARTAVAAVIARLDQAE